MRKFINLIVIGGALACASLSHAIGRSGNGKLVGTEDGFEADAPSAFFMPDSLPNGGLRLNRSFVMPGSGHQSAYIDILRLTAEFPSMGELKRADFVKGFVDQGWTSMPSANACIETLRYKGHGTEAAIVAWGPDKGVVVLTAESDLGTAAVEEIVETLVIDSGACSWK
ncbi:MAG: hypothetical protein AAB250_11820 [Bdellovibrionota bacterium]